MNPGFEALRIGAGNQDSVLGSIIGCDFAGHPPI